MSTGRVWKSNNVGPPRRSRYDTYRGRTYNRDSEDIELAEAKEDIPTENFNTFELAEVRRAFIRKVYGLLAVELLIVTVITLIFLFTPLRDLVYRSPGWMAVLIVLAVISFPSLKTL